MPHASPRRALKAAGCCLLAAAALALPPAAHAIYKWVDEKGVTHFSENPPPDGRKANKVDVKVTPPSGPAKPAGDWKEREQRMRQQRIEKDQKSDYEKGKAHNERAERANRCNFAKRQLQILALQRPVYSVNDRGEKVYVEDKDRAAEEARWTAEVSRSCD